MTRQKRPCRRCRTPVKRGAYCRSCQRKLRAKLDAIHMLGQL